MEDALQIEIKDWIKKIRYELNYLEELLIKNRLDDCEMYEDFQSERVSMNKFIKELKEETKES
jgi:hypothetical protein